jgi:hypothetical protein
MLALQIISKLVIIYENMFKVQLIYEIKID